MVLAMTGKTAQLGIWQDSRRLHETRQPSCGSPSQRRSSASAFIYLVE